jgi:hypothetical protein
MAEMPIPPAADTPRRRFLFGSGAVASLAAIPPASAADQPFADHTFNVRNFGATGDGKTDDTAAIQKALNACGRTGGVVSVGVGTFLVKGRLIVPDHVTLEGVFRSPTARTQGYGSTILAVGGRGKSDGDPLFFLKSNAALKGLAVHYPEQDARRPVEYPWCIRGQGDNIAVRDVLLVNPWSGIDFGNYPCGRHLVSGVYGQPLHTGLFVDQCLDCGRLENVHFWPFWTTDPLPVSRRDGTAFRFARTDWQMVSAAFCLGYRTGFHFTAIRHDAGNAMVVNSGTDLCDVGVRVEYSQVHAGVLFTNCQINAGVQVDAGSLGPVKFSNCGLFGTGTPDHPLLGTEVTRATHALHLGQGRMTFVGCHFYYPEGPFVPKGATEPEHPAVHSDGAGLTVSACDFTGIKRQHIRLGPTAKSTVVVGSRFLGGLRVENQGKGKLEVMCNLDD